MFKNDRAMWEQEYLLSDESTSSQELLVSFTSDPTPLNTGDAPRGWRHWRGTLTVTGARLDGVTGVDFVNPTTQSLAHDGNTVRFATHTRGDTSVFSCRT